MKNDVAQQIGELVASGRKIEAIKLLRETAGLGLAEAKAIIDAVEGGGQLPPFANDAVERAPTRVDGELPHDVLELAQRGNRLGAIARLREVRGLGLKEAKDAIDRAVPAPVGAGKRGCLMPLLFGLLCGGAFVIH
jgi:ribosomal protein L7/L12